MSALIDLIALAGAIACLWVIVSHLVRLARKGRPWILEGGWGLTVPLYGCGCLACLAVAGGQAVIILPTALLLAVAFVPLGLAWWRALRKGQGPEVGRRILSGLWYQAKGGPAYIRDDVQRILALLRRDPGPEAAPAGGRVPVRATPGVPPWRRTVPGVPSITADPALGPVPAPSEVSAALAASNVMVPAAWAAVAAEAADHEPDNEEEHVEHMDGEVAGILTFAEGAMSRAETLGDVTGLDPAYISAQFELADVYADTAAHAAQVMKRYHDIYDDIREAADGKPLPANRYWFSDGGAGAGVPPMGGQAA